MSDSNQRTRFSSDAERARDDPNSTFEKEHYDRGQDDPVFKRLPRTFLEWFHIIWNDPKKSALAKVFQIFLIFIMTANAVFLFLLISSRLDKDDINIEGNKLSQIFIPALPYDSLIDSNQTFMGQTIDADRIRSSGYRLHETDINSHNHP